MSSAGTELRPLVALTADPELRVLDIRQVRQLAVAVALSRNDLLPGSEVPLAYVADMRRLAAVRASGLGWRAAFEACGLEPPDASEVALLAHALRDDLKVLWGATEPVLGGLEHKSPGFVFARLTDHLRRLL